MSSCPRIKLKEFRSNKLIEFLDKIISSNDWISLDEIYVRVLEEFGEVVCEPTEICPHSSSSEPEYYHTIRWTLQDGKTKRGFISDKEGNWSIGNPFKQIDKVFSDDYVKEFSGTIAYKSKPNITATFLHGEIVDELKTELELLDFNVFNDKQRDLFIRNREGKIEVLFEIKTDMSTNSIYKGIGQLLIYSLLLPSKPILVLTLPGDLESEIIKEKLEERLGIRILTYSIDETETIIFNKLNEYF